MTAFHPAAVLLTGGAGFIGANLVRHILRHEPTVQVIVLDALTYAGNIESLDDVAAAHGEDGDGRYHFVRGDIRDPVLVSDILAGRGVESLTGKRVPRPDALLHLAAESHVDRSILAPAEFVSTNVMGTHNLLACVAAELEERPRDFRFINVSTDEVYGSLVPEDRPFTEATPLQPNSPYSASKAGADHLVRAYRETFGLPAITTRSSNNYGPFQFPEKLIPLMVTRAIRNLALPVYGDGLQVRDWIHVQDHCEAIWRVTTTGSLDDEVYNIGGEAELRNLEVVRAVLAVLGKPESLISFVRDRPGHDRRYAMDIGRIRRRLDWRPSHSFETGLEETVKWYLANERWWIRVESEAYRAANAMYLTAVDI